MANPNVSEAGAGIIVKPGLSPDAYGAGEWTDGGVDRLGYSSAVLALQVGLAYDDPESFTVSAKLQHSDTSGSGYTDVSGAEVTVADMFTMGRKNVDLAGVKRYVRVSVTVAFVGGSSPTVGTSAALVLAGAVDKPTA